MYFARFNETILKDALYKKHITTEEYLLIEEFWNTSQLKDISEENAEFLKSLGIQFEVFENKLKITDFPYHKKMCLTMCARDPRIWKYCDEMDEVFLFGYIISIDKCQLVKSEKELSPD